jgi:tryptophan-rich sensory protein
MAQTISANRSFVGLLGWLGLCFAAESTAVIFLPGRWYSHLHKAAWTPPSYLFAPIWTVLYVLMAVAAWKVWREGGFRKQTFALGLFLVQLALNSAWSFVCFGTHALPLSVANMTLLWLAVLGTVRAFFAANRFAGWLLVPYLAFLTFAASLNVALWWLNR